MQSLLQHRWFAAGVLVCGAVALGLAINLLHFLFLPVGVVLYDTAFDMVVGVGLAAGVAWFVFRRSALLNALETTLCLTLAMVIGLAYAISVPTVIDRSLSIYILEKLDQRGGGIRQDAMADVFVQEYLPEHRLVDIRLTEQLNSGTIRIENGCVLLTDRGRRIIGFTRFYRQYILPKQREIMGELSSDLTDPFRSSTGDVDYHCGPSDGTEISAAGQ